MAESPAPSKALIRLPQVKKIIPYSSSTIYSMVARGEFPAPVKIGPRGSAWVESEVLAHAERLIAQRDKSARGD